LNRAASFYHPASNSLLGGLDEHGQAGTRAGHRAFAADQVSALRGKLGWNPQGQKAFLVSISIFSKAFAQLTYRESLRDIKACLRAQASKLYHMGIKAQWRYSHSVARTTA